MALSFTQRVALAPSLARRRTPRASSVCAAGSSRKRSSGAKKGGSPPGPRPQPAGARPQPAGARPQQPPARVPPPGPPPAGAAAQGTPAAGARVPPASQAAPSTPSANGVASSAAPRGAVVNAALSTSLGLSIVGMASRNFASSASLRWPVPDLAAGMPLPSLALDGTALQLPTLELSHVGYALAVAAGVTAARAASLALWPAFREDSERANSQVLPSLSTLDLLLVSVTTGASEELLFRCTLLPLCSPAWLGVVVSAAVFGVLHISGGRRVSFAVWATAVGLAYGTLAVVLRDGTAPMIAHAAANVAGGLMWRAANPEAVAAGNASTAALAQAAERQQAAVTQQSGAAVEAAKPKTAAPDVSSAVKRPPWGRPDED